MSKIVDESFKNVGQQPGIQIWRIENFNLNKLKPNQYGIIQPHLWTFPFLKGNSILSIKGYFYSGDSYLILNVKILINFIIKRKLFQTCLLKTIGEKNRPTNWDIHFWLGVESTVDEYATAAYKAVELDDFLGGRPVQYREVIYNLINSNKF